MNSSRRLVYPLEAQLSEVATEVRHVLRGAEDQLICVGPT